MPSSSSIIFVRSSASSKPSRSRPRSMPARATSSTARSSIQASAHGPRRPPRSSLPCSASAPCRRRAQRRSASLRPGEDQTGINRETKDIMTKQIRLNAFDMNCVGHIQHGMWTHPRDRSTAYNTTRILAGSGADRGTRQVRRHVPRRHRGRLRRLQGRPGPVDRACRAGAGERPDAAGAGHGGGHEASRLRRDRQLDLRAALSVRPPHVDAGPPDRGPDRLEHRDRLSRQRRARHGVDGAARAR